MDDFEAFRKKKLAEKGKSGPKTRLGLKGGKKLKFGGGPSKAAGAGGGAADDDFEAFRKKKLVEKKMARDGLDSNKHHEFKVEEEGKAKGLVSHHRKLLEVSPDDLPEVKGFDSHIKRANIDPESIEKFQGKQLWGADLPKVDPDSVEKIKGLSTHMAEKIEVDPASIETPSGLIRHTTEKQELDPASLESPAGLQRY